MIGKRTRTADRMLNWWVRFHRRRWYWRWTAKGALLGLVIFAVCFPYPSVFLRHLQHIRDPNTMIEPNAPPLAPMLAEMRPQLEGADSAPAMLDAVERFVCRKIEYAFDWETWGVIDYLPTVEEVVSSGREDCDGRAVLAASLLRKLGFEANLVADGAHVWVWTPQGEIMNPNAVKALHAKADGVEVNWAGLRALPKAAAYGVAVFPLPREVIVALALFLVMLRPGMSPIQAGVCALLLALSLALGRHGGKDWAEPILWAQYAGSAALVAALILRSDVVRRCI